ncbi:hypothetical protein RRG08_062879 [Elysia crispata]|uniref:Uncharacterized protein n=1 Tax=Elysia crispata TaxID=231223 RepID=A0AAE1BA65_9GAST|nr:hypothetical protein RRG08_062879 [Elysia crispata]
MTSKNIIQRTTWVGKQAECLAELAELNIDLRMAKCIVRDHPHVRGGCKQYAIAYGHLGTEHKSDCQEEMWNYLVGLWDLHMYELIRADLPTRCYMDIDFAKPEESHERVVQDVLEAMQEFVGGHGDFLEPLYRRIV